MEETRTLIDVGNGVKITMPCDKLMSAMAQMQAVLDMAKKDSDNPYFKSKYADLAQCLATAKKPMADNGLSISQHCTFDGAFVQCVSVLAHSSGQMMVSTLTIPVSKKDAQGIGSSITYARRYALSAIVGIAQKDDDGNGSVGVTQEDIDNKWAKKNAKEQEKEKAMEENQRRLDEQENWRLITPDYIEVKAKKRDGGYEWKNLDDVTLKALEFLRDDERFEEIKQDIQNRIDSIKNAEK